MISSFPPDSHQQMMADGNPAWSGQRHIGGGFIASSIIEQHFADVDGLQELKAADVLNVRRRIATCSRTPQIRIFDMPLTDRVNKDKQRNAIHKNFYNTSQEARDEK
jgi:hypothetical protein